MRPLSTAGGSFYVGSTVDLERRIWQHNEGLGAAYTRRRRPVRLVWSAQYDRVDQAYAYEKQLQGWGRAKRKALIEGRRRGTVKWSRDGAGAPPRPTG